MTSTAPDTPRKRGRPRGSSIDRAILKGAARAFAAHGYAACRIEDILQAAGVSRTHFYRRFSNKDQLYRRLVARHLDYAQRRLRAVPQGFEADLPPQERLRRIIETDVEVAFEAGPFLTVLLRDLGRSEAHADLWREKDAFFLDLLTDMIDAAGYPRPEPLLLAAIISGIEHILVGLTETEIDPEIRRQSAVALIGQLLSALRAPGAGDGSQ
ncbi:MAG: TetR/AcrR family transcriptional regulator [Pseudodonghicola sp.]